MRSFKFNQKWKSRGRKSKKVNISLENKLNFVQWEEYKISDLFEVKTSRGFDAGKMDFVKKSSKTIEFIGRSKDNYGVQGYVKELSTKPNDHNVISVNQIGYVHAQIRKNPWYSSQNIFILSPKNVDLINLSVLSAINKGLEKYTGGYSSYPTLESLKKDKIWLPTKNGEIDFKFINELTKELEAQRIAELEAYLTATGLKDYKITKEEDLAIRRLSNNLGSNVLDIKWSEFKINDLFEVNSSKKTFNANKLNIYKKQENGLLPYVTRTSKTNGIVGFIKENINFSNPGDSLTFGQDTFKVFYQKQDFFTGNNIKILLPKFKQMTNYKLKFISLCLQKSVEKLSWGTNSDFDFINNIKFHLPTKNGEIDFEFMETLISAVQKLVIKDVVKWADKRIEYTKQIVQ
ncbi:restriction endonuclease subunit S [Mycoplasmopsis citelli]|uniref:restriction endonuclease subunit S n=1 Tax=Mycoplasmopsis citelli TaxID=171281 RepID=UPI0021153833|nr:restriction endonuclease subunit S [Mycoplasmopsis citelli]UUD36325.1 restriction endonuclease subunit S [Mycoplasmopsis citelli]